MQNPTAFTMAIGSIGPSIAIGIIGAAALFGMARNPENSDKIQLAMIIAIAFAEAISIYALIVALILKFVA
ncbi:ATP synthase F0 subunit C [candidate division WWE3 bacterium CG10_big_fil_rev_8_21_14_0_10_32_10]|uniref:ATP synthase subunit c n=1 Tax=candidate division WWE3 bacterium CG10_big_fil_rev_8_21_14_0_10_32_10 TaxID=1975090 RepID=A0A2H0RB56_UNCKA|nr:MAG: ATP synthase F0 subunit C [candidate division WWE3 bacterium CG10_big_fil_rev_8_21_14_0_10_32_10]